MVENSGLSFSKVIRKAHQLMVIEKKPFECSIYLKNILENNVIEDIGIVYWLALSYLENKEYEKAKEIYLKMNAFYQVGFCELLMGNLVEAKRCWNRTVRSEVSNWSRAFTCLVEGHVADEPTFLGIRNHLETDLGYLLRANQIDFAENLISMIDVLADINLESYKFVGRSLLNNGFENQSVKYLIMGQKALPGDPEIYYHLGQYSLSVGAKEEAKSMFNHCILISPSYTPAKDRLREIKESKI